MRERERMSEIRSSELETRLSSSDDPVEKGNDKIGRAHV